MLIEANANLQARNNSTGWVPLHEAAASGNLEAVKELLSCRVPHMPRALSGELPIDFAEENGHLPVIDYLSKIKLIFIIFSHILVNYLIYSKLPPFTANNSQGAMVPRHFGPKSGCGNFEGVLQQIESLEY